MLILSHRAVIKSPSHHACCGLTSNTQAISRGGGHIFYIRRSFFPPTASVHKAAGGMLVKLSQKYQKSKAAEAFPAA